MTVRVAGIAAAPGVARGPWATVVRAPLQRGGRIGPGDDEAAAVDAAVRAAATRAGEELLALSDRAAAEGREEEAGILAAGSAIALDPALLDGATRRIRDERLDGVEAILAAGEEVAALLGALDDELLQARATDVLDVVDRIARHVGGLPTDETTLEAAAIVVADDLPPSLTATLPRERILGILLEASSPTAHAAILARAYRIPAVVGARGIRAALATAGPGATVAIDGGTGEVFIAPDAGTLAELERRAAGFAASRERDLGEASLPTVTRDGTAVALLANIGGPDEAAPARALGARGVGLFRTEFLFLERTTPPSEDEQVAAYRAVLEAFGDDPVTVRLLDVGGDKAIPYLPIAPEENPFLGVRGLRLAVDRPGLFVGQLRACLRAAAGARPGQVKVMAPMVADAADVALLEGLAAQARGDLERTGVAVGGIVLGAMLEVPSAVLTADAWFPRLGFASIGTNDLTQYTLAVDRGNAALERYRDALHPAVLRMIALSVGAARRAGIELSVCGELAGDPAGALALVGLGVRSLSMSATSLPAVRRAIRGADLAALEVTAAATLADPGAAEVRARFARLLVPEA